MYLTSTNKLNHIIHEAEGDVEFWIDREVMEARVVHFHPNRNTASVVLTGEMFRSYLTQLGVSFRKL